MLKWKIRLNLHLNLMALASPHGFDNKKTSCTRPCYVLSYDTVCGRFPEWPKGADCKSVSDAFEGSNPSPPIIEPLPFGGGFIFFIY